MYIYIFIYVTNYTKETTSRRENWMKESEEISQRTYMHNT